MKKNLIKSLLQKSGLLLVFVTSILFSGCYSVFSGGTGGIVVDAESTSSPKTGISGVDVYVYTSEKLRNSDFNSWNGTGVFVPSADYYGHTSTNAAGEFTLSKIVWKSFAPKFGKDADVSELYILFYHENYGLVKGNTLIVSDSASDTVYQELTRIRKTTLVNFNLVDVASGTNTGENIYVRITVPQATEKNPSALDKVFDGNFTSAGTLAISYPRWLSDADKNAGVENKPQVLISYFQSAEEETWRGCYNGDALKDYDFYEEGFELEKTVFNDSYDLNLYGKKSKIRMPVFNGTYGDASNASSDGKRIGATATIGSIIVDCGETTTVPQSLGTSSVEKHGVFYGLGQNVYFYPGEYSGKYVVASVQFTVNGIASGTPVSVRSDVSSYQITLN